MGGSAGTWTGGDGCGRLQAEKDCSGRETGGNSDSGGPDDAEETRKPHASQNWPVTAPPQRGQVAPSLAAVARPPARCLPVMPSARDGQSLILVPQTSQKSSLAEP